MAEIEYGGVKASGSKLLLIIPLLGTIGGGLWGGFEFYKDYQDMKEQIQSYVAPDLSGFDKQIAIQQEHQVTVERHMDFVSEELELFKGAIPSKIFEASSMKKPLLLGVDGEAKKHFIEKGKAGLYFIPEDPESLKTQILYLMDNPKERDKMGENARNYVSSFFNRNKIASDLFIVS